MDFKGQYYCERTFQILVVLFGIIGFFAGYLQQDFRLTFYFLATGGGLSALVCAACSLRVLGSARVNLDVPSYSSHAPHQPLHCPFPRLADLPAGLAMVEPAPTVVAGAARG